MDIVIISLSILMTSESLVSFQININGKPLPDTVQVEHIKAVLHADQESVVSIMFKENSLSDLKVPISIEKDCGLELLLGYDGNNGSVFVGTVCAIELRINTQEGQLFVVNALSDIEYEAEDDSVLTLNYGENLLKFDGIAHVDEDKVNGRYPAELDINTQGTTKVQPENMVTLNGCTDLFDGNYEVLSIAHLVEGDNWITEMVLSA